jgi:hypothetical protein
MHTRHLRHDRGTATWVRAPRASREVWVDEHGRPLSARQVRELKRLLHESDNRGTRRYRGASTSFDRAWR